MFVAQLLAASCWVYVRKLSEWLCFERAWKCSDSWAAIALTLPIGIRFLFLNVKWHIPGNGEGRWHVGLEGSCDPFSNLNSSFSRVQCNFQTDLLILSPIKVLNRTKSRYCKSENVSNMIQSCWPHYLPILNQPLRVVLFSPPLNSLGPPAQGYHVLVCLGFAWSMCVVRST